MPHSELTLADLSQYFHLPMTEVARKLGMCATVLKKQCRKLGIPRWPHRKMKSFEKQIHLLESSLPRDPEDQERINLEIQYLVRQREDLMKDPARNMCRRRVYMPSLAGGKAAILPKSDSSPIQTPTALTTTTTTTTTVSSALMDVERSEVPNSRPVSLSRRQSLSHFGGEVDYSCYDPIRLEAGQSRPPTPTYYSSLLTVPVPNAPLLPPSHISSSSFVTQHPMFDTPKPARRLSVTSVQQVQTVETPVEAPPEFMNDGMIPRRRSTSVFTQVPSSQVLALQPEPLGPYVCPSPLAPSQFQFFPQTFYTNSAAQAQAQPYLYFFQTNSPQGPMLTPPGTSPTALSPKEPMQVLQPTLFSQSFFDVPGINGNGAHQNSVCSGREGCGERNNHHNPTDLGSPKSEPPSPMPKPHTQSPKTPLSQSAEAVLTSLPRKGLPPIRDCATVSNC